MKKALSILLESVESSQIEKLGYVDGILIVQFKGGSKYLYTNVNEFTYNSLKSSESVGSFFSKYIKNDESIQCIKLEF